MKKLLSILAVSGIVATSAPTVVACGHSTTTIVKKDLNTDSIAIYIDHSIYDDVWNNLAEQAGEDVTANNIKNDRNITINFNDEGGAHLPNGGSTIGVYGTTYTLIIDITKNDKYFNTVTSFSKDLTPITNDIKTNLNTDSITIYIGHDIYDDVRQNLASQASQDITAEDIKNDQLIKITFNNSAGNALPDDGTTIGVADTTYTLIINITESDQYFNQVSNFTKIIDPLVIKPDFNTANIMIYIGHDIYNDVYKNLAEQAGENVTATDIANDIFISVNFNNAAGDHLPDDGTVTGLDGVTYSLTIHIYESDQYFNKIENFVKDYIPSSTKINLDTTNIAIYVGHNIYNDIREFIASKALDSITAADIKNDPSISIQFKDKVSGVHIVDDETAIAIDGTIYTLTIHISPEDQYFNIFTSDSDLTPLSIK